VVATWHFNPSLTFVLNGDAGSQTNSGLALPSAFFTPGTVDAFGTGTWSGLAGYANYAINSTWSVTGRAEYFADYGGLRTGQTMRWAEGTFTLQWAPNPNLIVRAEIRGDEANQLFFAYGTGTGGGPLLSRYNRQLGIETVVKWP